MHGVAVSFRKRDTFRLLPGRVQELEFQPTWVIAGQTPSEWAASLAGNLSAGGWNGSVATRVGAAYAANAAVSPQLALSSMSTDFMNTCAFWGLATQALGTPGAARTAPIYVMLSAWRPSAPFPTVIPAYSTPYAMHMWDLIAAFRAWDFNISDPVNQESTFVPAPRDEAYGAAVRGIYYSFMTGAVPSGMEAINAAPGWPAAYNIFVLGNATDGSPAPGVNAPDFHIDLCNMWTSLGVGQSYWWSN